MDHPYPWLHDLVAQVPDAVQPLVVAAAAAVPYVEGEGAAVLGILAGIDPLVAGVAAAAGNILCVVAVVLLGARVRGGVQARRAARVAAPVQVAETPALAAARGASGASGGSSGAGGDGDAPVRGGARQTGGSKGRVRLRRWMHRFGVPGASLLAPLALPTMLTAAFFVASGVRKEWVILWQVVAIVVWTGLVVAAATGLLAVLGW